MARFDPLVHKLVITDFLTPGLTGLEIAESIRTRSRTTPIVLISGSAEEPDEQRAAQAGLRFLRKPVAFAEFKATLAAAVAEACRTGAVGAIVPGSTKGRPGCQLAASAAA